jgi:hypothetical protein
MKRALLTGITGQEAQIWRNEKRPGRGVQIRLQACLPTGP